MTYRLKAENLQEMFELSNFAIPSNQIVFVGLRGTSPVDMAGTAFAAGHDMNDLGIDYLHMRCSLIQWNTADDTFAVFAGSTVPNVNAVRRGIANGGRGVNQLATCFLAKGASVDRRYYKGDHGLSSPFGPHRAFRNDNKLPVWRTSDDSDYDGDDDLQFATAFDNMHCGRQPNPALPGYSSNGCQVIAGVPGGSISSGNRSEQGPWKRFVDKCYGIEQSRYPYALFEFGEAQRTVSIGAANRSPTVRFGSKGTLVSSLQDGLIRAGYDLGPAGTDGEFGFATLAALRDFQRRSFGAQGVDLIAGAMTAAKLGISWPTPTSSPGSDGAEPRPGHAHEDGGTYNEKYRVTFNSLYPGGFYSADPDDLSVRRSIRTNNPGALNITAWQKEFRGYVGFTQADHAGNKTTIYRTPEHGVGAWLHLLVARYNYGLDGEIRLGELARRYAGVDDEENSAVRSYIAGWKRHSGRNFTRATMIRIGNDEDLLALALGMFGHEIGDPTPLEKDQIKLGFKLYKEGHLPQ